MATAKKPTAKKSAPVFDVSKPGAPSVSSSSTSRAIIIKHQTVKDPMVNATPAKTEPAKTDESTAKVVTASPAAKKIVIQPIHATLDEAVALPAEPDSVAVSTEVAEQPAEKASATTEPITITEIKKPVNNPVEAPEDKVSHDDKPVIDDQTVTAERIKRVNDLVTSEQYFLPIETSEHRRSKRTAIIGVCTILLLVAAWYNVSLDAELLPNTYNLPHTSFFSAN
jgi:hypothetical protein